MPWETAPSANLVSNKPHISQLCHCEMIKFLPTIKKMIKQVSCFGVLDWVMVSDTYMYLSVLNNLTLRSYDFVWVNAPLTLQSISSLYNPL